MYNFGLTKEESIVAIFDDVLIKYDKEIVCSVAITNKRILFLDYLNDEFMDNLNGAHASSNIKYKEVFLYKDIKDIKSISTNKIIFKDSSIIEIDNKDFFKALKEL